MIQIGRVIWEDADGSLLILLVNDLSIKARDTVRITHWPEQKKATLVKIRGKKEITRARKNADGSITIDRDVSRAAKGGIKVRLAKNLGLTPGMAQLVQEESGKATISQ